MRWQDIQNLFAGYITNNYVRAAIIFIALVIVLRIAFTLFGKIILKLVSKTKTDIDDLIITKLSKPITILAFLLSFRFALNQLPLTDTLESTIAKIVYSVITLVTGYIIYALIEVAILRSWSRIASKTQSKIDDSIISILQGIIQIALLALALLYILDYWGVQVGPFLAGLGIAGLAVALALQSTLSNIISGIALILDKTLRVGDYIYIDQDTKGIIEKVGLRSTKIKTFDNELVIIPNNKIADNRLQNLSLPEPKSRITIPFSVAYGTNIDKVKELVLKEIKTIKHYCHEPAPVVRFISMGESALNFGAYFFITNPELKADVTDEANTKIYNTLNKHKIVIPFKQIDVRITKD